MLRRLRNECLLRPSDLRPSQDDLEVIGVFNPGAVATEQGVVLLARVAEQAAERREDQTALPRWDVESSRVVLDWEKHDELSPVDIRVVRRRRQGLVRLTFLSHLRVFHSRDGRSIDSIEGARFEPANEYEEFGVEDPRITPIGDRFCITYVAVSRHGVATALASTKDFKSFERHGIIFYPENKDVVLFPERIGGQYYALHRPNGATPFCKPEMWLAASPDLIHWGGQEHFLGGSQVWDIGRIGAGTPPLRTAQGWLEMYHGNSRQAAARPGKSAPNPWSARTALCAGTGLRTPGFRAQRSFPDRHCRTRRNGPDLLRGCGYLHRRRRILFGGNFEGDEQAVSKNRAFPSGGGYSALGVAHLGKAL